MPEAMERKLKAVATKYYNRGKLKGKGSKKEKMNAFVFGTMRKTGWKPSREK